ncbi:DUF1697 domain-containing protein [Myroides fluvii]|uniref:DUF1697 domain-containing protein n=1 Tax=Myroides fluvii TaxID=2572594 RepID=UPI00131CBEC7|nr:DUF1697 domain-containing protein [Myroides fluvii]
MQTFISLLRGINVSGKNTIKMEVLKQLASNLNFTQVQTYIQSGNLLFQSEELDEKHLSNRIQHAIKAELGLVVPVLTLSATTFESIVNQCPFTQAEEQAQLYISFFDSIPTTPNNAQILEKVTPEERLAFSDSAAYLVATQGYGRTKITNALFEQKLDLIATTRNYKTCIKLIELAHTMQ